GPGLRPPAGGPADPGGGEPVAVRPVREPGPPGLPWTGSDRAVRSHRVPARRGRSLPDDAGPTLVLLVLARTRPGRVGRCGAPAAEALHRRPRARAGAARLPPEPALVPGQDAEGKGGPG